MFYSSGFFTVLIWLSFIGLIIDFGFQIWYNIVDFKNKSLW